MLVFGSRKRDLIPVGHIPDKTSWPYIQIRFMLVNERLNVELIFPHLMAVSHLLVGCVRLMLSLIKKCPGVLVFMLSSFHVFNGFLFPNSGFQVCKFPSCQDLNFSSFRVFKFSGFQVSGFSEEGILLLLLLFLPRILGRCV